MPSAEPKIPWHRKLASFLDDSNTADDEVVEYRIRECKRSGPAAKIDSSANHS
jgi:hypothetical protein